MITCVMCFVSLLNYKANKKSLINIGSLKQSFWDFHLLQKVKLNLKVKNRFRLVNFSAFKVSGIALIILSIPLTFYLNWLVLFSVFYVCIVNSVCLRFIFDLCAGFHNRLRVWLYAFRSIGLSIILFCTIGYMFAIDTYLINI